jgi:isoquinoline 1-oxidoreductase beta subunit
VIDGIGTAMYGELTFENGVVSKSNFDQYRQIRMKEAPTSIETFFVDNGEDPSGLGEPAYPPVFAALANALYRATGNRFYNQPFSRQLNS